MPEYRTDVPSWRLNRSSLPAFPFLIRDAWNGHERIACAHIVSQTVHAADSMQLVSLDASMSSLLSNVFALAMYVN